MGTESVYLTPVKESGGQTVPYTYQLQGGQYVNTILVSCSKLCPRAHWAGTRFHAGMPWQAAPLKRLSHLDHVAYYSPTETFGGKDRIQAFTAYGQVLEKAPYQVQMGENFFPFRRDVQWHSARLAPIAPLLHSMQWSADQSNWGYMLRRGIFEITGHDMQCIATAMQVNGDALTPQLQCNDVQLEMPLI